MPLPPLRDPPSLRKRLIGTAKAVPASAFLFTSLLVANLAQTLSLVIKPFSGAAFRRINRFIADTWWGWCVILSHWLQGIDIVHTGDDPPMRENAIVIANHQQMSDIPFLMILARRKDRLGDLKWLVKDLVKYVPGIGWGMKFLDCLFVKRDWAADRESVERTFARLIGNRVPLWLISFPEGTRQTPDKLARSRSYAEANGLPVPRHVLIPRTKGFAASVKGLRGHATAVYDVTIGYEQGVPTLWQYIKGFAPTAHLHVRRYPISELPESDDEVSTWLLRRFEEKDRLLDGFYSSGAFSPAEPRSDAAEQRPN